MPSCKNDPNRKYKGTEPSPKGLGFCAHSMKIGAVKKGKDGNKWEVRQIKNGSKRWMKVKKNDKKVNKIKNVKIKLEQSISQKISNFFSKKDKSKLLIINKNIKVIIYTNLIFKLNKSDKTKIKSYIKKTIGEMGSSYNGEISKYFKLTKPNVNIYKNKINIIINIKLEPNEYNFTENKLKEHIKWSLNEASYRGDAYKINNKDFIIPKKNIIKIEIL